MKMKALNKALAAVLILGSAAVMTSCGNDDSAGMIDMGVTTNSLILRTSAQSCVDKSTVSTDGVITRSLSAPTLSIAGISVTWHPTDLDLYVGVIEVTITSPQITGGKIITDLDALEVEALLGAKNATLKRADAATTPRTYSSTSASTVKDTSSSNVALYPCGLGVGSITLAKGTDTPTFTAQVKIELIGTATNSDGTTQKTVIKTITTSAQYIGGN